MDAFWLIDPYILIKHYDEIIPNSTMTLEQQLNAITRLAIYYIILVILFYDNPDMMIYGIIVIIMLVIYYYIDANEEKFETLEGVPCTSCSIDKNTVFDNPIKPSGGKQSNPLMGDGGNKLLESGYIDSDGNYKIGPEYTAYTERDIKIPIKNKECRKPTVDNPFANVVFSDYLDLENIPEPCNVDSDQITQEMQNLYNSSIYRNTSDVYERENSQRMFYTTAVLDVPNGQGDFADWCFKAPPTCKENTANCTYFDQSLMQSARY